MNTTKKNLNTEQSMSLPRFDPGISRMQVRSVTAWAKFLGPYVLVGMSVQYSSECKYLRLETLRVKKHLSVNNNLKKKLQNGRRVVALLDGSFCYCPY